jgi:thiol-disulfide isomerase/thioredoxin
MFSILFMGLLAVPLFAEEGGSSVWSVGEKAAGTQDMLAPVTIQSIAVPSWLKDRIQEETAVFYFSPTCPHCQHALPEIQRVFASGIPVIGVTTKNTDEFMSKAFVQAYNVTFPIIHDADGNFAQSFAAKFTPSVYMLSPQKEVNKGEENTLNLADSYHSFRRGMGSVLLLKRQKNPFAHFKGYQGTHVCASCHTQEAKSWAISHHSQAYNTLKKIDKLKNDECVSCHVVGLNEPTGFTLEDHTSSLKDVGCEACHTASGPHDNEYEDPKTSCVGCHDEKHSIAFSVEKGLPHIDHFLANNLSEDAYEHRRDQIEAGEGERHMLAMPKGEYIGSERCTSCHEEVHPQDPHINAYKTLKDESRNDLSCVACHSTPKKEIPQKLSDYQSKDGVGCESCHGPGEAHAKSPTLDNIVRLGNSCAQCVLESLCTSCHTSEWDEDWNLETRIKLYRNSNILPKTPEE